MSQREGQCATEEGEDLHKMLFIKVLSSPSEGFVKKFIFFHPVVPGSSKGDTFPEKAQL